MDLIEKIPTKSPT